MFATCRFTIRGPSTDRRWRYTRGTFLIPGLDRRFTSVLGLVSGFSGDTAGVGRPGALTGAAGRYSSTTIFMFRGARVSSTVFPVNEAISGRDRMGHRCGASAMLEALRIIAAMASPIAIPVEV